MTPKETNGPKVGQWLYASCSAEYYGKIVGVGEDANHCPTVDIKMEYPESDLARCEHEDKNEPGQPFFAPLTELELPQGDVILRGVQYRMSGEGHIVCNTPGTGCYRCKNLFSLEDERRRL